MASFLPLRGGKKNFLRRKTCYILYILLAIPSRRAEEQLVDNMFVELFEMFFLSLSISPLVFLLVWVHIKNPLVGCDATC